MILSWGKITPYFRPYKSGAYGSGDTWTEMSVPVEGSTQMNITEGETKEAKQEGGAIVDTITGDNTYEFVFRLFVKKEDAANPYPIPVVNGKTTTEYALFAVPEDPACLAVEIPRAQVRCVEQFTSDEGITLEYHFKALLDESQATGHHNDGKLVRITIGLSGGKSSYAVPGILEYGSEASSLGVTLVGFSGVPTASYYPTSANYVTATIAQNAAIFALSANTGDARSVSVTLTDAAGNTAVIDISQAAGN